MRASADAARDLVVGYLDSIGDLPSWDTDGLEGVLSSLREPAPEAGAPLEELLERVREAAGLGFNTPGPGYLAYVPGGGLWSAALADFVALALNRFVGVWEAAPAFVQIEAQAIRWMADLFGYPAEAGGILTSGGSLSNFSAVVAARHALLGDRLSEGVLYASDQVHARC